MIYSATSTINRTERPQPTSTARAPQVTNTLETVVVCGIAFMFAIAAALLLALTTACSTLTGAFGVEVFRFILFVE